MTQHPPRPDKLIELWHITARAEGERQIYMEAIMSLVEGLTASLPDRPRMDVLERLARCARNVERSNVAYLVEMAINEQGWSRDFTNGWQPTAEQSA